MTVRLTQCSTGASLSTVSPTGVYGVVPAHMASSDPSAVRTTCLVQFATLGWAPSPPGQSGSKFSSAPVAAAHAALVTDRSKRASSKPKPSGGLTGIPETRAPRRVGVGLRVAERQQPAAVGPREHAVAHGAEVVLLV